MTSSKEFKWFGSPDRSKYIIKQRKLLMIDSVTKFILWVRQRSFFRAVQRTLVMLMPIAVLGSYFSLLHDSVFTPDGIIYNIFNLDAIMSDHVWYGGAFVCQGMVQVTFGVFGVYAAYFAAHYTARLYQKDSTMAGMTAVILFSFIIYSLLRAIAASFFAAILAGIWPPKSVNTVEMIIKISA